MGRGETRGWGRTVSYSGWLPGGDRVSSTPPPTLPSVLGRRSETSRPFREPGCEWVYPAPLARQRPGATRAPGPLSEAREIFGPLIFSQTGYNTGRRPAGAGPSPRPSAQGAGSCARPVRPLPLRSGSGSTAPNPPHSVPTFLAAGGLGALGPGMYCAGPALWEIRQRRNSPGWLEFAFATYFHSRSAR